jgi:translation elongation factor P/translation initiation factor 5A
LILDLRKQLEENGHRILSSGEAKARIDAVGIFDGVKRSIVQPVSAKTMCLSSSERAAR